MKKYTLKSMTINHYNFTPCDDGYNVLCCGELLGTSYPDSFKALINYAKEGGNKLMSIKRISKHNFYCVFMGFKAYARIYDITFLTI